MLAKNIIPETILKSKSGKTNKLYKKVIPVVTDHNIKE
jgi:hypothetical protein